MGRKKKTNTEPGAYANKRSAKSEAFAGLQDKKERTRKKKAAATPSPVFKLCQKLARTFGGAAVEKTIADTIDQIKERGLDLDDVAAVLVTRIALVESAFASAGLSVEKALTELGSCNRQMADLAEQFRQQGRALPSAVEFTFNLQSGAIQAPGILPDDAPILKHDPEIGDLIEVN